MANPEYVIVSKTKPHNSLWAIAEHYLGSGTKYKQLAAINKISNPDYIVVGQKIYLSKPEATLSTASVTMDGHSYAHIQNLGWVPYTENSLVANFYAGHDTINEFNVQWEYLTDDGVWHDPSNSSDARYATVKMDSYENGYPHGSDVYSPPTASNVVTVRVKVKTETPDYEKEDWSSYWSIGVHVRPPLQLPAPQIRVEDNTVITSLTQIPDEVKNVMFYLYRDNSALEYMSGYAPVVTGWAEAIFNISSDFDNQPHVYKARCQGYNSSGAGPYSLYTDNVTIQPSGLCEITECQAVSANAVKLKWTSLAAATAYEVQYSDNIDHIDAIGMNTIVQIEEGFTECTIGNLAAGARYFFRVRGKNESGVSIWSEMISIGVGTIPTPPTTWSSVAAVSLGEPVLLYWIHNSEDGSSQTAARIQITVNGEDLDPILTTASEYTLPTLAYTEGATIRWCVQTAGVTGEFGEYSIPREITVYAPITLTLTATDATGNAVGTLSSFPLRIIGAVGSSNQTPVGYHVNVISNETYNTVDRVGNQVTVQKGESVYSQYFATSDALSVELSACDIDLESGISYTIGCVVSMDTGLTKENSISFTVNWTDIMFEPYADISVDKKDFSASITPHCKFVTRRCYKVTETNGAYTVADEEIDFVFGDIIPKVKTVTGENVYYGITGDGIETYYCYIDTISVVEGVTLAVYRREFDGSFTELVTGIENGSGTSIVDPHPALDYARYRIVATQTATGAISYSDTSPIYVGGDSIVIQWEEAWSNFLDGNDRYMRNPIAWSGSMVKLKANIDVSPQTNRDVSLVDYVGRKHSVSYYGTRIGETASWSAVIPKDDVETLYALRRLSVWMGNAYVREPSGMGYWATVNVSFSQKHNDVAIPVTFDITRVEGGV